MEMSDLALKSKELKEYVYKYGRELDQCQEVAFRCNASGEIYDEKSTLINKATVLKVQELFGFANWEVEACTDAVHILGKVMGFNPTVFTVADEITSKPEALVGKSSWVYPPVGASFKLDPFVPQQWQWGKYLKEVLNKPSVQETNMVVVVPTTVSTPDSNLVYALDNRIITMGLRKWTKKVILAENVEQGSLDSSGRLNVDRIDSPLLFLLLSSKCNYSDIVVSKIMSQFTTGQQHAQLFPAPCREGGGAKHVRIDASSDVIESTMDLMKVLNGFETDTTSSYLGDRDNMNRFSLSHLPSKLWYGPKQWSYFDFFVNEEEYALLEEGREEYESKGVRFAVVQAEHGYLCSHLPGLGKKRKEAPDVRTSMEFLPFMDKLMISAVVWSKFDVLIHLQESADPKVVAKELMDHDKLTLTRLIGAQRVFGDSNEVVPPMVLLHHPLSLTHQELAGYATKFGGVRSITPGKKGGIAVVTFVHIESAYAACGCKVLLGNHGSILFTSGRSTKDECYNGMVPCGVCDSIESRVQFCASFASLTSASLDSLQLQHQQTHQQDQQFQFQQPLLPQTSQFQHQQPNQQQHQFSEAHQSLPEPEPVHMTRSKAKKGRQDEESMNVT